MEWIIGILIIALQLICYVVLPLVAIWFIARGGRVTRVIIFIASVIVVAVISFSTGFSAHEHNARAAFNEQFGRPFRDLSEHLHLLLTNGNVDQATVLSEQMMKQELVFSTKGTATNTLRDFIQSMQER
jgi:hypothetical protein